MGVWGGVYCFILVVEWVFLVFYEVCKCVWCVCIGCGKLSFVGRIGIVWYVEGLWFFLEFCGCYRFYV